MKAYTPADPQTFIFDPPQVSALAVGKVNSPDFKNQPHYNTFLPDSFDDTFVMFRKKRVVGLLADTSNYKTGLATILARNFTPQLRENEIGLFCTWEDSVEDFAIADMASFSRIDLPAIYGGRMSADDYDNFMSASIRRSRTPLWLAGHSESIDARRPRLTMTDVWNACEYIEDKQKKLIGFVFLDYLQRINRADTGTNDMREGHIAIMDKVKDLSHAFNTCVVIGSQVRREIEKREWRQPTDHDAQETSNYEQTCDGIITLQLPARYRAPYPDKDALLSMNKSNQAVYVTKNLLCAQIVKQKKAAFGDLFCWSVDYDHNEINSYQTPRGIA